VEIRPFDGAAGGHIDAWGSDFTLVPLLRHRGLAQVSSMHLGPHQRVGRHSAVGDQLFCVVSGGGFVSGEDDVAVAIEAEQAAFWAKGEQHRAWTDSGMTAIVIELVDPEP
jgi:quercetin dioxygenase-like cupin family protein